MKKIKNIAAIGLALVSAAMIGGCASDNKDKPDNDQTEIVQPEQPMPEQPMPEQPELPETPPAVTLPEEPDPEPAPAVKTVSYIKLTADGVNIRSGAGTGYSVKGSAEKSTMYVLGGATGGWYKTNYKNDSAYVSTQYCLIVNMPSSNDDRVESVISEGSKLLGTRYVYGAARYHNGNGVIAKDFNINAFDCSSLMQYIFYKGAGVNLQVTSRTQSTQGKNVPKANIQRGDLLFFTNSTRYNKSGVERIGHVALYLGENWILHTASDYAKIEQISTTRWSYFIKAQRVI